MGGCQKIIQSIKSHLTGQGDGGLREGIFERPVKMALGILYYAIDMPNNQPEKMTIFQSAGETNFFVAQKNNKFSYKTDKFCKRYGKKLHTAMEV
jgi:hypothetical protein